MKRIPVYLLLLLAMLPLPLYSQVGRIVSSVNLFDLNNSNIRIPYLGERVFSVFYIDPDVQEIAAPFADAIKAWKFSKDNFGALGVVNCKDTWYPNGAILNQARRKQASMKKTILMLDKSRTLSSTWNLGACNNSIIIMVIGKDSKIKFIKTLRSRDECLEAMTLLKRTIEEEINN